jgi:GT2 family glycosyltransferase
MIAVSIVSHGHGSMVAALVARVLEFAEVTRVLVTFNVPEILALPDDPRVQVLRNSNPKGFAANQNAAFEHVGEAFYCPLNPDVVLEANPFPELLRVLQATGCALAVPAVVNPAGAIEDSVRHFPTPFALFIKAIGGDDGRYRFAIGDPPFEVEWAAGMFMLFRSSVYRQLGGFDPSFFLYYEDVDICLRTWRAGERVVVCPTVTVIHDARRDSRKSARHFRWHIGSLIRFLLRHWGRFPAAAVGSPTREGR